MLMVAKKSTRPKPHALVTMHLVEVFRKCPRTECMWYLITLVNSAVD